MDKYEQTVYLNSKKHLREHTGAVCTTNPARWRLGSRLRLGGTSQLLQFGRTTFTSSVWWLPDLQLTADWRPKFGALSSQPSSGRTFNSGEHVHTALVGQHGLSSQYCWYLKFWHLTLPWLNLFDLTLTYLGKIVGVLSNDHDIRLM